MQYWSRTSRVAGAAGAPGTPGNDDAGWVCRAEIRAVETDATTKPPTTRTASETDRTPVRDRALLRRYWPGNRIYLRGGRWAAVGLRSGTVVRVNCARSPVHR